MCSGACLVWRTAYPLRLHPSVPIDGMYAAKDEVLPDGQIHIKKGELFNIWMTGCCVFYAYGFDLCVSAWATGWSIGFSPYVMSRLPQVNHCTIRSQAVFQLLLAPREIAAPACWFSYCVQSPVLLTCFMYSLHLDIRMRWRLIGQVWGPDAEEFKVSRWLDETKPTAFEVQ